MPTNFELYAPDANGAGCQRLLPLNELSNTVTFFRITTFNALVDLNPPSGGGGIRPGDLRPIHPGLTATLALPLSALNIAFAEETKPGAIDLGGGHKIVAGLDATFLPSDKPQALADKLSLAVLPVRNPAVIRPGTVTLGGTKVEIAAGTRAALERYGEAFVRAASGAIVKLALDVEEIIVSDEKTLLEKRRLMSGQQLRRVDVDDAGMRNLQRRRPTLARMGTKPVRLVFPPGTQVLPFPPGFGGVPGFGKPAPKPKRPRYEIAILSTIEQDWKLLGYSRGAMLSSITLAPREQLSIEVFTFDRLKTEQEQTFGTEFESNLEVNSLVRGSTAVASEVTQTLGVEGGLKGGATIQAVDIGGNVSASNEVQSSLDFQTERINETTRNVSERFKATHQVRIVEARETGTETRSTRRLQNPNFSRTLTLNYFEILENYRVITRVLPKKQWCVLVENPPIGPFDVDTVLAYEHRLQEVLLSPNYRSGFAAARILKAQRWFEASQVKDDLEGDNGAGTADGESATESTTEPIPNTGVFATARSLNDVLAQFLALKDEIDGALDTLFEHYKPRIGDSPVSESELKAAELTVRKHLFWLKLTSIYPDIEAKAEHYTTTVGPLLTDNRNQDEVLRQLALLVDGLDDGWLFAVKGVAFDIVVGLLIALVTIEAGLVLGPVLIGLATGTDLGLPETIDKARRQLRQTEQAQEQATTESVVAPADGAAAAVAPAAAPPVPQVFSLQDLAQANADFAALQLHLEKHKVFYQNEIWRVEDVNARYERLRLLKLTRFIDNRLLGFAGSKSIFPLRLSALPDDVAKTLVEKYASFREEDIKQWQENVTLPTAGVHMESLLGQCDALEPYLQERRAIDLQTRKAQAIRTEAEAQQQIEEAKRLQMRLTHNPPLLDPPSTVVVPALPGDSLFDG